MESAKLPLTRENSLFPELRNAFPSADDRRALKCKMPANFPVKGSASVERDVTGALSHDLARLISSSICDATRSGYQSDLRYFFSWGGSIPSDERTVAEYLAHLSKALRPATIARRLASISKAHRTGGFENPSSSEVVRSVMRGIRRQLGTKQREAKPILRDDLYVFLDGLGQDRRACRDKAILLIGFASGCRRSEITALDIEDIEFVREGVKLNIRKSKTDQESKGRTVGVPFGRSRYCAVRALEQWFDDSGVCEGAIFRPIDRHGNISRNRLSGEAISIIVKRASEIAGFDPKQFSGHSLRSGLVTSAALAGVSLWKIRQQTGHSSDAMLGRYIRVAEMFVDNAAGQLL